MQRPHQQLEQNIDSQNKQNANTLEEDQRGQLKMLLSVA